MDSKHTVRFEPVGIEIDVDEEQTVLRGAAEQGLMLMHGCKEGQCAACKSFVLDGEDIELEKYSTFALPDFEKEEGFTLLCRAHVYEDVTIELLNYDEEMIRSGHPIQRARAEVVSIEPITQDLRHVKLKIVDPDKVNFFAGQYFDITIPGSEDSRSFSLANTPAGGGTELEFVIRVYPDGRFSRYLDNDMRAGDVLDVTGPFGVFTLRDGRESDMVFLGGGAGMAPILSVLRSLAERGSTRKATYYYGARQVHDLCFTDELHGLEDQLENFRFVPALSAHDESGTDVWEGELGLITDVMSKNETDLSETDCYVCGPPPMVEAAMEALVALGADEKHIYYDKFTTTGDPERE